ncbi:MAG: hypothetical protein WD077_10620 [Bacteroidia bacterium]
MEFLDLMMILLPSVVVFLTAFFILKKFLEAEYNLRKLDMRMKHAQTTLPIQLQAYERMILLMERLTPNNLIFRTKQPGMSATDLQVALLAEIRAEFDHNLSQQLYISQAGWEHVKQAKEEVIKLINISYSHLQNEDATALELSKVIFNNVISIEAVPTQKALDHLKREAQKLF